MHKNINKLLDDVVDGLLEHELKVSNIQIIKNYTEDLPSVITDGNQLKQVVLNIINNAVDAISPPGKITIFTSYNDKNIFIPKINCDWNPANNPIQNKWHMEELIV